MATALAYGLAISASGLDTGTRIAGRHAWPAVSIEQDPAPMRRVGPELDDARAGVRLEDARGGVRLDGERAELELGDGTHSLRMTRVQGQAVFHGPRIPPDELAHPYLWPVASVFSRWLGREAFHAGAVIVDGGAWALLGPKEAGKSSLLAAHAARGGAVLADDLVVVEDASAFAGPRCIDLRNPLPGMSADGARLTRAGTRLRMALPPLEPAVPLRGWVFLSWGESMELRRVPAVTCLSRLARWRAWGELPSDASAILQLAALPAFELTRERQWSALGASLELLQELGDTARGRVGCTGPSAR